MRVQVFSDEVSAAVRPLLDELDRTRENLSVALVLLDAVTDPMTPRPQRLEAREVARQFLETQDTEHDQECPA